MARFELDKLQGNDIRGPERMAKVRKEWNKAPTVRQFEGRQVRLTGYAAVLNPEQGGSAVLLMPYDPPAVQYPYPPANQMVVVILQDGMPPEMAGRPVWVTGTLRTQQVTTPHGLAAYAMQGAHWSPYPFRAHPFLPYTFRW